VLAEPVARWLLVLHTGLGVAAVATGTHLVVWLRRYLRGQSGRRRAVVKFAWLFFALQLGSFALGNAMYPTYRVQVRAAYLENTSAVAEDALARERDIGHFDDREHIAPDEPTATTALVRRAAQAARWFDVKEHWIAMGILASAAVVLVLTLWDVSALVIGPFVLGLAVLACATTWLGAIIGVLTAAWRAV
jgi:hypothetical protein